MPMLNCDHHCLPEAGHGRLSEDPPHDDQPLTRERLRERQANPSQTENIDFKISFSRTCVLSQAGAMVLRFSTTLIIESTK